MAKVKISDFSATPASNTDIDGINLAEGCAPSGINDAIRELMAQLKDFQTGAAGDSFNGPVGTATAAAGAFTTLSASSTVSGTGFSTYLASPPAIGGTAAAAVSATTLTTSSTVTHNGGTANGVAYLNGSKALTTGSALTFDGTNLGIGVTPSSKLDLGGTVSSTEQIRFSMGGNVAWIGSVGSGTANGLGNLTFWTRDGSSAVVRYQIDGTGNSIWSVGGSEQMRLTSTGLGIGTSSPASKLTVSRGGSAGLVSNFTDGLAQGLGLTTGTGYFGFFNPNYGAITFRDGGNAIENMRLTDSGNLGLGVTPSAWGSGYKAMQIAGYVAFAQRPVGSGDLILSWNAFNTSGNTSGSGYVYKNTGDVASSYEQNGAHRWYVAPSGTAGNAISFTQAMTLDASGRLGIGTTSPNTTLSIGNGGGGNGLGILLSRGTGTNFLEAYDGTKTLIAGTDSSNDYVKIGSLFSHPLGFVTGNAERARITSGGYFKASDDGVYAGAANTWHEFNQSANSIGLAVVADNASLTSSVVEISAARNTTNNSYYFLDCAVAGVAYRFRVADSGNVTNTNNSYGAISDVKLKENVTDATPKLDKLNQVRVVNFNMIGSEQKQLGVVAQELEQIFPGMVDESPDFDKEGNDLGTTTKSVKYSVFVPMLIKAMQEQQAIINTLTARVAQLESN
jgi:hypothetical protein